MKKLPTSATYWDIKCALEDILDDANVAVGQQALWEMESISWQLEDIIERHDRLGILSQPDFRDFNIPSLLDEVYLADNNDYRPFYHVRALENLESIFSTGRI